MQRSTFLGLAWQAQSLLPGLAYAANAPDYVEIAVMNYTDFQDAIIDAGGAEILSQLSTEFAKHPGMVTRAGNNYLVPTENGKIAIATTAYDVAHDPEAETFFGKVAGMKLSPGDEVALTDVLHFLIDRAKFDRAREANAAKVDDQVLTYEAANDDKKIASEGMSAALLMTEADIQEPIALRPAGLPNEPGVDDVETIAYAADTQKHSSFMKRLASFTTAMTRSLAHNARRRHHGNPKRSTGQFFGRFALS